MLLTSPCGPPQLLTKRTLLRTDVDHQTPGARRAFICSTRGSEASEHGATWRRPHALGTKCFFV
eukprot:16267531-Heterocapsa_arctica.AAC.1